jgi:hypothetical protein
VHFGNQHPLLFPVSFVNRPKDFWKNELKDFSNKSGAEGSRSAESGSMLLDVLEGYLKYEVFSLTRSLTYSGIISFP